MVGGEALDPTDLRERPSYLVEGRSPRLLGKLPMGDGARSDSAAGQFFFANRRHTKGIGCTMGQFRTSRPFRAFGAHQACRYHQERTVMSMSNGSAMSTGVAPLLRLVIARSGRIAATDLTAAVRDRSCRGSPRRRSALLQRPLPARPVYERDGLIFWVLLEGGVRGRRQVRATGPRTGLQKFSRSVRASASWLRTAVRGPNFPSLTSPASGRVRPSFPEAA